LRPFSIRNDLDLRAVASLRRLLRVEVYDIVHFHTKRAHALALWLRHGGSRPRFVVTRRMDYPERSGWYTNCLYNRKVDGVVAISQAIRDLLEQAGVDARKIRRIPSGIEPRRFEACASKRTVSNGVSVVGCLAGLEERKGHHFLLQAAALLKSEGLHLRYRIAGDGSARARLEQEAVRLGLRDDVDFLGFVADTADFFVGVDLLAMPSLYEGLGVAVLEAMAAGKAVVASRVGGMIESVIDGVTGILVAPKDARALAEGIAKLVRAPSLADEMGRQARERVLQHFTVERMAMQNESYYYDLLQAAT
jgi:glycosyltransferase involved in cell wall biosynthesis